MRDYCTCGEWFATRSFLLMHIYHENLERGEVKHGVKESEK